MTDPALLVALQNTPGNFLQRIADLERQVEELQIGNSASGGSSGSEDGENVIRDGTVVFQLALFPAAGVTVTDPQSSSYTGVYIAGEGLTYGSVAYNLGGINAGVIQTGINTTDGTLYAINANISGVLTIGAGSTAGGWVIDASSIHDAAGMVGLSSAVTGGDDIRFWAGNTTPASAPFYVTESGALVATSATITGVITANTGNIGGATGWVITANTIKDVAGLTGLSNAVTGGDDIRFWAGNTTPASAPFYVTESGALVASSATISGTITATTGAIGGWTVAATTLSAGSITLNSSTPSILMGSATAVGTGAGMFLGLASGVYQFRIGDPSANNLIWNGSTLAANGQWIKQAGLNPSLQTWTTNIAFTSASDTQVNWSSGTITLGASGTSYSISAGNTGAMAALTYIYLDIAISLTVLQTTTTYSTAVGDGKILIATAQNATAGASVLPQNGQQPIINGGAQITALSILAGNIAAGAITAAKISVSSLSAITATMGNLTIDSTLTMNGSGGAITIGTTPPSSATVGTGLWIDRTGLYSLSANTQNTTLTSAGLTAAGGALVLNNSGITITAGGAYADLRSYKFTDGTNIFMKMQAYFTSGVTSFQALMPGVASHDNIYSTSVSSVTGQNSSFSVIVGTEAAIALIRDTAGVHQIRMNSAQGDADFIVYSQSTTDLIYADASTARVGIAMSNPARVLDVTGTFGATGAVTLGATLAVAGDIAVNTNKFTVTAASGNTTIAGTLVVTGVTTHTGGTVTGATGDTVLLEKTGTFVPRVFGTATAGTGTYTTQLGAYWERGRLVYIEIELNVTAHTGTGNMRVDGLPYSKANNGIDSPMAVQWSNITLAAVGNKVMPAVLANTQIIAINEIGSGAASALPLDTSFILRMSGFYLKT